MSGDKATDDIDALRDYLKKFIEAANMSQHTRSMSLSKMQELVFWLRAGEASRDRP
jgi:hypothetical protein